MLEHAREYREDILNGRLVIETRHRRQPWEVIVEPDLPEHRPIVIAVYEVER